MFSNSMHSKIYFVLHNRYFDSESHFRALSIYTYILVSTYTCTYVRVLSLKKDEARYQEIAPLKFEMFE